MNTKFELGEVLYHISENRETAKGTLVKIEKGLKSDGEIYTCYTIKYSNNHLNSFHESNLYRSKNEALDVLVERLRNQYD